MKGERPEPVTFSVKVAGIELYLVSLVKWRPAQDVPSATLPSRKNLILPRRSRKTRQWRCKFCVVVLIIILNTTYLINMYGAGEQPHLSTSEAARFATLAYTYGSGQGDENQKRREVAEELENTGWQMRFDMSNRQLSALYNRKEDHLHVAHKGTQPNSGFGMMDLVSDLKLGMAQESSSYQFNYRLKQTEKIYQSIKPKIFTMSGHSLGGATVIYALENSKLLRKAIDQADTFNAGANPWPSISNNLKYLNPFKYRQYKREDKRKAQKLNAVVTHHRMKNDFVSVSMRAKPPHGEVRMYPLGQAVGPERKGELDKMNPISKGLEAHHLHHFEDEGKAHMNNYKSTNYKKPKQKGQGIARQPESSKPAGGPRDRRMEGRNPSTRARIRRSITRNSSLLRVLQPFLREVGIAPQQARVLFREVQEPFKTLRQNARNGEDLDEDALSEFTDSLVVFIEMNGEDAEQKMPSSSGDQPAPPS